MKRKIEKIISPIFNDNNNNIEDDLSEIFNSVQDKMSEIFKTIKAEVSKIFKVIKEAILGNNDDSIVDDFINFVKDADDFLDLAGKNEDDLE